MSEASNAQHSGEGGKKDSPHQVKCTMKMVSSKKTDGSCWKILGTEIIKLIIDFEGFLCTGYSNMYTITFITVILITI